MANMSKLKQIFSEDSALEALLEIKSAEDALACLNGNGAELDQAELLDLVAFLSNAARGRSESMSLDDMESVAGGGLYQELTKFGGFVLMETIDSTFAKAQAIATGLEKMYDLWKNGVPDAPKQEKTNGEF